ncbi:MAG TPA: transketolase [Lautropia sp.]|nr:transketolase [Lautropia sp.]
MADSVRVLAMDAVEQARSGHPGMPMGMADIAVALWAGHLKHSPAHPTWFDRDRFVLSNGHGSMLLYALLHLTGYDLPIEEVKRFRQLHSRTPGHPEHGMTPGVETTTGPLGQGLGNAVGMALAEKLLAQEFNRPGFDVVSHFTYVFVGDGCLMEGISHEVCSLAGVLSLSRLIVLYDDNGISIDGEVKDWFGDNTVQRFESYGWNVIARIDGHDAWAVDQALAQAREWATEGRVVDADGTRRFAPTFIDCKTLIGKGAPTKAGTGKVHGEALGAEEVAATRKALNWTSAPFEIPCDVYASWDATATGAQQQALWEDLFKAYADRYPVQAGELERRMRGVLPADWERISAAMVDDALGKAESIATRAASRQALNHLGPALPELLGGSADLTGSNLTDWKGVQPLRLVPVAKPLETSEAKTADGKPAAVPGENRGALTAGRHINYGVREFGMCAVMTGLALHGGYLPYGGTFLVFSDYARNALRLAALSRQRVVYVFTHDSIGLGEDGPTHQPVEHASTLRAIPNMTVWRPADTVETAVAWSSAISHEEGPTALLLSRQALPFLARTPAQVADIRRGAYVVRDVPSPRAVLLATGSEVAVALAAAMALENDGIAVKVVSMPSTSVFDRQDVTYKRALLPDNVPRVAVEAGVTDFWWKYRCEAVVGIDRFGESAPAPELFRFFGITQENVADTVRVVLAGGPATPQ